MNCLRIFINGFDTHCVIDDPQPSIALIKSGDTAADQCAIKVTDVNGADIWHSGAITFGPHIRYAGGELQPKTHYIVTVVLYHMGKISAEAQTSFETGLLGTPWQAQWIEPQQRTAVGEAEIQVHDLFKPNPDFFGGQDRLRPCRELKKIILLDMPPAHARIYASAHGIYELFVNGVPASRGYFAPETSTYQKWLYYQTFDVTQLLHAGENEIRLFLADGWWIGRIGISGDSCQYGDRLGCIVQTDIRLGDGSQCSLGSDASFLGRRSNIDYADLFIGQRVDFTHPDEPWRPCHVVNYDKSNLFAQPTAPVEIYAQYEPEWSVSKKGELLADFGQCLAGVPDITVHGDEGQEITLDFCEVLDQNGNFLRNILGRNKDQRDVIVCTEGENHFFPKFTYHGFRYARINGARKKQIKKMTARAMGTRLRTRGRFSCSDDRLNRLQENIWQSTRSNMFSIPTDCPQREKAGWTGDILAFAPTACFNFYLDNFLCAWLTNMRLEQFDTGEIPVVIPNYPMQDKMQKNFGGSSSSAWSDACVLVPWYVYQSYGDVRVLQENKLMMERWLRFVEEQCSIRPHDIHLRSDAEQKWNDFLFNKGHHFGDWFIPSFVRHEGGIMDATEATRDVVGSCFYAVTLETYLRVLQALGQNSDMHSETRSKYSQVAERLATVRHAIQECYIDSKGIIRGDLQGLYVIALRAGVVEGDLKEKLVSRLLELIEDNGYRLDTGFVSTPHLLDVLADNGRMDVACRLLFQTESPSWLYMVEKGATTIWENWEAIKPDGTTMPSSFNHYALGSVGDFIYRRIGGISVEDAGYRKIRFSPGIHCGLSHARCEVETAYGTVSCSWRWEKEKCMIDLTIPWGCSAIFSLESRFEALESGTHRLCVP